ncbi:MAG: carotenoid oxygenase family protein [Cyclobacteriaceae bacterium]|nr:carotenoid oxygenase family protein [Cyclobacteriaceae bacterium HetDA_MAG_MS6]
MEKLLSATRKELDIELNVIEGEIPRTIHGFMFINSAVGSINSGGLPYERGNDEFNTPIFNGDGYVVKLDFTEKGKIKLKSRLMKTPSYYADEALRENGPARDNKKYEGWEFKNNGMARMSKVLGQRNQANVAVVPVKFRESEPLRMLATYEAGRPWEINSETLDVIAPAGKSEDYLSLVPSWFLRYPFPAVLSSSHPVYDFETKEMFTVSFIQGMDVMLSLKKLRFKAVENPVETERKLVNAIDKALELEGEERRNHFKSWLLNAHPKDDQHFSESTKIGFLEGLKDKFVQDDEVRLLRWDGTPDLKKWRVRCDGKDISITQNMHQMGITEDYIILSNSSLKINLSLMFNYLWPQYPHLEEKLRKLLSSPMIPQSELYFIKRKDLKTGDDVVSAVKAIIPLETVHFTPNYLNPNNRITVMTAHNTANCPAEWIRYFDKRLVDGEPVDPDHLSYLSTGQMDIGRMGRMVFDAETGELLEDQSDVLFKKGNIEEPEKIGPHTWGVGLYSFRGYEELMPRVREIKNIYWQIFGLDRNFLTEFVYELYRDYPNRVASVEEIERLTKEGVPIGLARVDHSEQEMDIKDFYLFEEDHHMRSIQFIPNEVRNPAVTEDMDGYILCTIKVPEEKQGHYTSQVWLWDATHLAKGPVCKLAHDQLCFAYTFHSVWTSEAEFTNPKDQIDIIDDIDDMVKLIINSNKQVKVEAFMDDYVYPHFANQKNKIADSDPADYLGRIHKWTANLFRKEKYPYETKFKEKKK